MEKVVNQASKDTKCHNQSSEISLMVDLHFIPNEDICINKDNITVSKSIDGTYLITHNGKEPSQCASCFVQNKLSKDKNYILRFQLLQNTQHNKRIFIVDLNAKDPRRNESLPQFDVGYSEDSGGDLDSIIKGTKLHAGHEDIGTNKILEMRFNLAKKYMRIADFPKYQNIATIKESKKIQEQVDYYINIFIGREGDEVRLLEFMSVGEFDAKMD